VADVIVIGGCNFDIKAKSTEANKLGTSNPGTVITSAGGVARNIAHNLARLGAKVSLLSAIGRDAMGDSVLETTRAAGVDVSRVQRVANATGTYIAILDRDGELITAMNDMQAVENLTPELIRTDADTLASARLVVADCNLPFASLSAIAEIARDKLLIEPVSVPKSQKLFKLLEAGPVAYATPNFDQIEALAGTREIEAAIAFLHDRGLRNAVIHAGPEGAFCSDGSDISHVAAMPAGPVMDVTGAGDGAVAGFVYGLLRGKSLVDAVAEGQKLAGRIIASERSFLE
jgi:pseudouridine kinase